MHALINYYLLEPTTDIVVAVTIPAVVSLTILVHQTLCGNVRSRFELSILVVGILLTLLTSFYDDTEYHVMPAYLLIACFGAGITGNTLNPGLMYVGMFLTTLIPDILAAWHVYHSTIDPVGEFYYGIGLAGVRDAMFLYPLFGVITGFAVNNRIKAGHRLRPSTVRC